jgi:nicotinamide riboside kinase
MSEWKEHTRKGKTRFVYQTETHAATVRQAKDSQWLWTVHSREAGTRILAHGKCEGQEEAESAALAAMGQETPAADQPCCVYFMGADSTGKSELVKYVARAYGMRKVPETARSVLHEEGYTLHSLRVRSADADEYQRAVFDRQIAQEAATPRPFVADRGLDNLAYASEYGRCFAELAAREEVARYVEAQRNDVVFLVRPHKALRAEDGVRMLPSWEEQQRLDAKIELLLQWWDIPHVIIAENAAARREEQIDWCLTARGFTKTA